MWQRAVRRRDMDGRQVSSLCLRRRTARRRAMGSLATLTAGIAKKIDVRKFTEQLLLIRDSSSGRRRPGVNNCKCLDMIPGKARWTGLRRGTDTE